MAIYIPVGQVGNYHGSRGERMVYDAFRQLPDDYIVFYSVKWGKQQNGYYQNGEADFLLFDPKRGFLVIEVKTGGIERNGRGEWFSISRDGSRHALKCSPLDQAWRSVSRFRTLLEGSSLKEVRKYKVIPTVWFPSVKTEDVRGKLPSEYQSANTFTGSNLDDPLAAISFAFDMNGLDKDLYDEVPKEQVEEVINVFAPTFKIVPGLSSELKENEFLFNQLTNEQATLLDYLSEQRVAGIQGVSGTGKTMIALECARRLPKETNVLFLCFNRLLLNFLRENFAEEMPNVTFANLNQLYARAGGNENAEKEEITRFLLESFNDNYQFEHIIIDEGQDFAAEHLDFLYKSMSAVGGYFYVFYDKKQLVHKWDQETIEWLKQLDCKLVLNKNCRNTYEIARASYSAVGIDDVVLAQEINGDVPCLNNYPSVKRAIEGIGETIRFYVAEKGFSQKQITILTVKTLEKTILAGRDSLRGYRLTQELDQFGVLFTTARKFKGLESDVVIVIDIDGDVFKDDNAKNVFYVASSRAKHCVTYIAALDDEAMRKIIMDLGETPRGDLKGMIKDLLKIDFQNID